VSCVTFVVSVKDPERVRNPGVYRSLVSRMVASIRNQGDRRWLLYLDGRSVPVELPRDDGRVQQVAVDFPVPGNERMAMNWNKTLKLRAGFERAQQTDARYCMFLDSDDCVRSDLVAFLLKASPRDPGWFLNEGFVYREGSSVAWRKTRDFHGVCGSSVILQQEKAGRFLDRFFAEGKPFCNLASPVLAHLGQLQPLPFPGVVYSVMNGDNIFMTQGKAAALRGKRPMFRYYARKLGYYRPAPCTPAFRRRFSLTRIAAGEEGCAASPLNPGVLETGGRPPQQAAFPLSVTRGKRARAGRPAR